MSIVDQEATREAGAEVGTAEAEPAAGVVPMEVSIATGKPWTRPEVWSPSGTEQDSCPSDLTVVQLFESSGVFPAASASSIHRCH